MYLKSFGKNHETHIKSLRSVLLGEPARCRFLLYQRADEKWEPPLSCNGANRMPVHPDILNFTATTTNPPGQQEMAAAAARLAGGGGGI